MKRETIYGCEARGDAGSAYLTRYTLLALWGCKLCLHVFHRSDADELHDHPWNFYSVILKGGYMERVRTGPHTTRLLHHRPGALLYRPAAHAHRVILYADAIEGPGEYREATTLVLMTRRRREWGFFTPSGWAWWRTYFRQKGC